MATRWLILSLTLLTVTSCFAEETDVEKAAEERSFSLFNIVKFKNDACVSSSSKMGGGNRNGTCYTSEECEDKGGKAEGNCAMGFGTCCVFITETCSSDVEQNCTYIRNENYPTAVTAAGTCKYTVKKCDPKVCTVRLDFETFTIGTWATTSTLDVGFTCDIDKFVVSGLSSGQTIPTICGKNAGQHMYLELGTGSSDTATMEFTFTGTGSRSYEIKVTQYLCDSAQRPPEGCLQYHVGTEGRLTTFNWAGGDGHLQNQFYSICLRQEEGFCCARYFPCEDDTRSMSLYLDNKDADAAAMQDGLCTADYLTIEGSSSSCNLNQVTNRYCGFKLSDTKLSKANVQICDCTPPLYVGIRTDAAADQADADGLSKGLCLDYVLEPCTGSRAN